MGNVIDFQPAFKDSDYVWRCDCGCLSFTLRADFVAVCLHCDAIAESEQGSWRTELPAPTGLVEPSEPGDFRITELGSSGAALKRTLGRANSEETAFVIVVQSDGAVSTWGETLDSIEHREWFDRRIAQARQMLMKE